MRIECKRCEAIVCELKSRQDWSTPEISRQSKVKVLQDLQVVFLRSGCDALGNKCLPLRTLEDEIYPDIKIRDKIT